jgi:hypothetical protein
VEDEYGEEDEDEDRRAVEEKPQERPTVPEFNKEDFLKGWLEENPVIEIPSEEELAPEADWILNEEEEQAILAAYIAGKDQA